MFPVCAYGGVVRYFGVLDLCVSVVYGSVMMAGACCERGFSVPRFCF